MTTKLIVLGLARVMGILVLACAFLGAAVPAAHAECDVESQVFADTAGDGAVWTINPLKKQQSRLIKLSLKIAPSTADCLITARLIEANSGLPIPPPLDAFTWNALTFKPQWTQWTSGDGPDMTAASTTLLATQRARTVEFRWRVTVTSAAMPGGYPLPLTGQQSLRARFRSVPATDACARPSTGGYQPGPPCPEQLALTTMYLAVSEQIDISFKGCGGGDPRYLKFAAIGDQRQACLAYDIAANVPLRLRFASKNGALLINDEAPGARAAYTGVAGYSGQANTARSVISSPAPLDPSVEFDPGLGLNQTGRLRLTITDTTDAYRAGVYSDEISVAVERR